MLVAACDSGARHVADSSAAANVPAATPAVVPPPAAAVVSTPALPAASVAAGDPAAALSRFLAYNVFRGAPAGDDSLSYCPPFDESGDDVQEGWEPDNYFGFVRPRVLDAALDKADTTGTSAKGRAELVRVAEIGRDSAGWVGRLEQRLDTLTFTIQRGPTGWTVCGPASKEGVDSRVSEMTFVIDYAAALRTEVNSARWLPAGMTWDGVAKHADSVTAHLP